MISKRTLFESTSVDKKKIDEFVLAWWTACFLERFAVPRLLLAPLACACSAKSHKSLQTLILRLYHYCWLM